VDKSGGKGFENLESLPSENRQIRSASNSSVKYVKLEGGIRPIAWVLAILLLSVPGKVRASSILLNGSFEVDPAIPTYDIDLLAGFTGITG
jgi:hypothetical protein